MRVAWGFDRSDLTPHPAVRFGVLSNGMRYAVMRSPAPAGSLSVRLHLDVGARDEGEREIGFAHIIEHMIFHGSEGIPEGALPLMLSSRGLQRWSDFNAFTSHDETVYRLDLGRADSGARETGLTLMREIAGRLLFTRENVAGAKRKVQEEIRARDLVRDRMDTAQNRLLVPGTRLAGGPVAGTTATVGRATPDALRALYERTYLPARATLVLVGDFDLPPVEEEIERHFADWKRPTHVESGPFPRAAPGSRGAAVHLFVDQDAPTTATIAAVEPIGGADDASRRDSSFLERLGTEMLTRRLARAAAVPPAPFVTASASLYEHFSTARVARIDVEARERDWAKGLQAVGMELRRALSQGFSPAELGEQLAETRRSLGRAARPRTSSALADAIVDAVGRGLVFTEPGDPDATIAYLARVRLQDVNEAFRAAWGKPDRLIFVSHHRAVPRAEATIRAAWSSGFNAPAVERQSPRAGVGSQPDE
ncbi:MAG TPA: pitrilysin family protein [Allosphingosinicella sp.]